MLDDSVSFYAAFGKRALDLGLVALLLPIMIPVIAALIVIVRRDGGPGIFGHARVGKDGRMFRCLKIRTMVVDAEAKLEAYLAANTAARTEWDRDVKLENDPRVTRLGSFLRKSSLDELPQILNVLMGDMSFVGPRPVPAKELETRYGPQADIYKAMKPGITGLWQVSGRNDVSYARRIKLDKRYLTTRSLWLDLKILVKTAGVVLDRTGK